MSTSNSKNNVYTFEAFSKYQPIGIKPVFGKNWVTNGVNNINFKIYRDAYDDSPTNASIINSYASYIFGEGIVGIDKYLSIDDQELAVKDLYKYGGCSLQVIWNKNNEPLKMEYIPIYKLAPNYDNQSVKVNGYWYSYDWENRYRYKPQLYPIFSGKWNENPLEIIYIRRPTEEPFFPIPDYLSGIPWAQIEGEIANTGVNKYRNGMEDITIINSNNGMIADPDEAKKDADEIREKVVGSNNAGKVVVSQNESMENALTVDRVAPPEFAQHNVFYSEEAERKLIVAHSAPKVIFAGSNTGNGFSSNADEREVAIKDLYRMKINPYRRTFISGIAPFFKAIGIEELEFKDFENNEELEEGVAKLDTTTNETMSKDFDIFGGPGSGRNPEGGGEDEKGIYNPPNIETLADGLKVGGKIENNKYTENGDKFNDKLSLALDISNGEKLTASGIPLSENFIKYNGNLESLSSVYFEKNGVIYRISDHDLPPKGGQSVSRPFMQKHTWIDNETAIKNGVDTKDLFYENNVEIIVKKGKIIKINKNFNY